MGSREGAACRKCTRHLPGLGQVPELQREWHRKYQVQSSAKSIRGTQEAVRDAIIIDPGSATYQLADLWQVTLLEPQFSHLQNGKESFLPLRKICSKIAAGQHGVVGKRLASRAWLCHFLAAQSWGVYVTSLLLSFLTSKIGTAIVKCFVQLL